MQNTNFLYDAINKQNDFRSVIINKSDEFFLIQPYFLY